MVEEEWNRLFERAVPIFSAGIGMLSLTLGIIALRSRSSVARRAYYHDGSYLVSVRFPGQWNDIRDFVQPANPDVVAIYHQYGPDYWSLFDFVCRNIDYRRDVGEFWQTPSETLARRQSDCEDTSILLTSLIRTGGDPDAYVALGSYAGYGHAWCQYRGGEILESTFTQARPVSDPEHYELYCLFNEQEVIELWPGALGEIFEIPREEATKLSLLALETNHA